MSISHIGDRVQVNTKVYDVKGHKYNPVTYEGYFLGLGVDYDEIETGVPAQFSCVIVEGEDGQITMPRADHVKII